MFDTSEFYRACVIFNAGETKSYTHLNITSIRRSAARSGLACGLVVAAATRTVPYVIPVTRPLAAPGKRQAAGIAYLGWQISLLAHVVMLPRS